MEIQFQQEPEPEPVQVRKSRKRKAAGTGTGTGTGSGKSNKKFIGVRQRPSGRWVAEIKDTTQKIRMWLGTFQSAEEAARAYDEAACLLRGANTRTNFLTPAARLPSNSPLASRITNLLNAKKKSDNDDIALAADANADPQKQQQQASYTSVVDEDEGVYRPDLGGSSLFSQEDISSYSWTNMGDNLEGEEERISASVYAMNGLHQYMKETDVSYEYDPLQLDAALWDLPPLSPLLTSPISY